MPRFLLCEANQDWSMALRWAMPDVASRMDVTASLDDCRAALVDSPRSVVGLEVRRESLEADVEFVTELKSQGTSVVALASRELAPAENLLREAGAVHVALSPRNLRPVARQIRRCLSQSKQSHSTLRDAIWARLPWATD